MLIASYVAFFAFIGCSVRNAVSAERRFNISLMSSLGRQWRSSQQQNSSNDVNIEDTRELVSLNILINACRRARVFSLSFVCFHYVWTTYGCLIAADSLRNN